MTFNQTLEKTLPIIVQQEVSKLATQNLQPDVALHKIFNEIKNEITATLINNQTYISDIAIKWLTMKYFKNLQINEMKISELIMMNEYSTKDLKTQDLEQLIKLLNNTLLYDDLSEELNSRKMLS